MKIERIPDVDRIDTIIKDYAITGMAKSSLLIIREHLCEQAGSKQGIHVVMDSETWKQLQVNFAENKKLKDELKNLKEMNIFSYLWFKIRRK